VPASTANPAGRPISVDTAHPIDGDLLDKQLASDQSLVSGGVGSAFRRPGIGQLGLG
jgi:hypothetical protein